MVSKTFFNTLTASQILKCGSVREISDELVNNVLSLNRNEAVIIKYDLYDFDKWANSEKFLKSGPEVVINSQMSLGKALREKKTPIQLRKESFDRVLNNALCAYVVKPFFGDDGRKRKFSLRDILEGARIYGYANSGIMGCPKIDINWVWGSEVEVEVPSRTKGQPRYKMKFSSVPVIDNQYKFAITNNIKSNHVCEDKHYYVKYPVVSTTGSASEVKFCGHEVAGYLGLVDYFYNEKNNIIPLQMNQFAIPSRLTADYYMNLLNNCLIQTSRDKKPRRLNRGEVEIMLWGAVHKIGHDKTFYADARRDGDLRDYDWRFENDK